MTAEQTVQSRADLVATTSLDSVALSATGLEEVGTLLSITYLSLSVVVLELPLQTHRSMVQPVTNTVGIVPKSRKSPCKGPRTCVTAFSVSTHRRRLGGGGAGEATRRENASGTMSPRGAYCRCREKVPRQGIRGFDRKIALELSAQVEIIVIPGLNGW